MGYMTESKNPTLPSGRLPEPERDQLADAVAEAFAEGRLTKDELDARIELVFTANTKADGDSALAGLPIRTSFGDGPIQAEVLPSLHHVEAHKPMAPHGGAWGSWLLTGIVCLVIWVVTSIAAGSALSFWPGWVIGPWGAVLLARQWAAVIDPSQWPRNTHRDWVDPRGQR